jgi:hypothetical protein
VELVPLVPVRLLEGGRWFVRGADKLLGHLPRLRKIL